jgi:hypothetical protein
MSNYIKMSFAVLLLFATTKTASAHFRFPEMMPIDRLVKNAEAYLAKHQNDADAHYTLARIRYLAFYSKQDHAPAFTDREGRLTPAPKWMVDSEHFRASKTPVIKLPIQELLEHAERGVQSFNTAIRLDSENAVYHLGLASLLEEFASWNEREKPKSLPLVLQGITPRQVRNTYWNAFFLAIVRDSKRRERPLLGLKGLSSYEAATAFVRLSRDTKEPLTENEKKQLKDAESAIANFEKLPPSGAITPIVFSFQPGSRLADLLDPDKTVDFDLRGYGLRESWPWVKPDLGFLVWDPGESGKIESARQMFGGYTFQIFWRTGYDALRALDDNDDGMLSGSELDGISVWFDRNGDGVSQPDEVVPLRRLGIVSIPVSANEYDGIHPTNPRGITMADGRTLRTWDWIVEPHGAARVAGR